MFNLYSPKLRFVTTEKSVTVFRSHK
jgi:hypothetical protein